jgi:hypothetical protein
MCCVVKHQVRLIYETDRQFVLIIHAMELLLFVTCMAAYKNDKAKAEALTKAHPSSY